MIYASILQVENFDIDFARCIKVEIENRFQIEKDIGILRFEDRFIDKIETFFINDIVFKDDMKQSELDAKKFSYYNELDVMLFRY